MKYLPRIEAIKFILKMARTQGIVAQFRVMYRVASGKRGSWLYKQIAHPHELPDRVALCRLKIVNVRKET